MVESIARGFAFMAILVSVGMTLAWAAHTSLWKVLEYVF